MNTDNDSQLVVRVQQGDKRAFDLLVVKYQTRIAQLVSRFVYDSGEVQDVVQESFIKAYRALPNFRGDSQFYTWLYRIAVNTAKNYLVSRGRRPPGTDIDVDDAVHFEGDNRLKDMADPAQQIQSEQLMKKVNESIKKLPEDLRVALTLREYDGLSYEEIADIMDCPVGTVRSRIFRAREAVEQAISPLVSNVAS